MNRREILKSMLTLSALSVAGGCRYFRKNPDHPVPGTKLGVILQGPFAVVLRKNAEHGMIAFVPKTNQDDLQHEFRFLTPMSKATITRCGPSYRFSLSHHGLAISDSEPQINHGFDNVRFTVDKWRPKMDEYFVALELPTPEKITYVPPLYPAVFESGDNSGGRLGSVPLNHILEYTVRSADDVLLRQEPSQDCARQDHRPVPLKDLLQGYEAYHQEMPDQALDPSLSQRPYIVRMLEQYSSIYFLGVGVPPLHNWNMPFSLERMAHGIRFFNDKLLPAIYQGQDIPPDAKLKKIGKDALQCNMGQSEFSAPAIRPAVWQYSMPQPHLSNVASTENCTSPVATAKSLN